MLYIYIVYIYIYNNLQKLTNYSMDVFLCFDLEITHKRQKWHSTANAIPSSAKP